MSEEQASHDRSATAKPDVQSGAKPAKAGSDPAKGPAAQKLVQGAAPPAEPLRLVVVPGQKDGDEKSDAAAAGAAPLLVAAPQKAAAPAKATAVVAPPKPPANSAVTSVPKPASSPVKNPFPAKARLTELENWSEPFAHDNFLSTMRRNRQRSFFIRLGIFVGLPTLLMTLYLFVWATPRYVSEFEITYQSYQNTQSLSSGLVQSLFIGSAIGVDLGSILYEYARSATLLQTLDEKLHLREYYSSDRVDYPGRLSPNASQEKFLNYYRNHIVDVSEGLGGYVTIDVHAFDPEFAHTLAQAIVSASDDMIDKMSDRARQDELKFAEDEVARQEERVRLAKKAETDFQNAHRDLNPTNTASQYGQLVGSLESQLAQANTALANARSYAGPTAPQVLSLKNQIAALETQLQQQRNRLTGGAKTYSQILDEYSRLQTEDQFAQNAYLSAQQGLAVARADAARKQSYLVDFVAPSKPSAPSASFYLTYLASAFLGSLSLYAIGSLLGGALRDQAGL